MKEIILLKMLKFFLKNPYKEVYLRELAKALKISPFASKKYIDMLTKESIIIEERKANLRYLHANINNLFFKYLKITYSINLMLKSSLVEYLKENIPNISSIVLFGSAAKGEDTEDSDIDLVVIGKEIYPNLKKIENILSKTINLHIFTWNEWNKKAKQDKAFYIEVISYGIALFGELPLIEWK